MALDTLVRNAVAVAHRVTGTLQATVQHHAWTGQDGFTKPTFDDPVSLTAIVDKRQRLIRTRDGQQVMSRHYIAFLEPITANGAPQREEPIDLRDKLVLPDGDTGPILDVTGFVDRGTGKPYFSEVWIG